MLKNRGEFSKILILFQFFLDFLNRFKTDNTITIGNRTINVKLFM